MAVAVAVAEQTAVAADKALRNDFLPPFHFRDVGSAGGNRTDVQKDPDPSFDRTSPHANLTESCSVVAAYSANTVADRDRIVADVVD